MIRVEVYSATEKAFSGKAWKCIGHVVSHDYTGHLRCFRVQVGDRDHNFFVCGKYDRSRLGVTREVDV